MKSHGQCLSYGSRETWMEHFFLDWAILIYFILFCLNESILWEVHVFFTWNLTPNNFVARREMQFTIVKETRMLWIETWILYFDHLNAVIYKS